MSFPVFDFLQRRAEIAPQQMAVEDLITGLSLSYSEMHLRTGQTATLLEKLEVQAGDRLALLCRNRIEFFEILIACARLQAILVPLNWRMPPAELNELIRDCGAKLLLYGAEDADSAAELSSNVLLTVNLDSVGDSGFEAQRDSLEPRLSDEGWPADAAWYLLYTSGTTGMPKAVIQTYGMALANYVNISQAMGLRAEDRTLCFLPLFHSGGINLTALPALIMGSGLLFTPGFDLQRTIELIQQGRLDTFFAVPAIYQAISLHVDFDQLDLSKIRCWACGGAPISNDLLLRFQAQGALILNGMGMTETGPTLFLMDKENAARKIGSVGKPQILSAVRIVGENGKDIVIGETGELWISGLGITPGYYGNAAATAEAKPDGTWLRSGDLARQDQDGYYYIVGRLKDMYISGGENIYAAEIENQLAGHPDVLEAAVIGIADQKWGEVGCAFLLLRPNRPMPSKDDLSNYLRSHLATYKIPHQFVQAEDFPRTAAGKIQKHLLPGVTDPLKPS